MRVVALHFPRLVKLHRGHVPLTLRYIWLWDIPVRTEVVVIDLDKVLFPMIARIGTATVGGAWPLLIIVNSGRIDRFLIVWATVKQAVFRTPCLLTLLIEV